MNIKDPQHLGDGVYVSFDGSGVNMAVNHHTNNVIYLEDFVIVHLIEYLKQVQEFRKERTTSHE